MSALVLWAYLPYVYGGGLSPVHRSRVVARLIDTCCCPKRRARFESRSDHFQCYTRLNNHELNAECWKAPS
jgi:hypothetical protein